MYKVFSGEKRILISDSPNRKILPLRRSPFGLADKEINFEEETKMITFKTAEDLHKEYKAFSRQYRQKKLIITGDEKITWNVFRSLFSNIEASGGIVKNEKGNLLMIYRNNHWDLPKGKIEKGELPAETALREVKEECGLKNLKILKQLASTNHIFFQNYSECIKHTYWFEMTCNDISNPVPQTSEGIIEAKWMSKKEVEKIENKIYPSLREIIAAVSF